MLEMAKESKTQTELERVGSEQAIEQREGREKRDSQGRATAEVLGGRSKAVISW